MLRRSAKIILASGCAAGVLGAGVAMAADSPTCPYGNTPRATQSQTQTQAPAQGTQQRLRLRERDGTGPRHAQRHGAGMGNRGADCPYRS